MTSTVMVIFALWPFVLLLQMKFLTVMQLQFTFLNMQMDPSAGIEEEYHHKSNRVSLISAMLIARLLFFWFEILLDGKYFMTCILN